MTILHRGSATPQTISASWVPALILAHVRNQLTAAINKLKTATLKARLWACSAASPALASLDPTSTALPSLVQPQPKPTTSPLATSASQGPLGERGEEIDTIAMHSAVAYLQQIGMLTFSTSALSASGAVTWGAAVLASAIPSRNLRRSARCDRRPADLPDQRHRNPAVKYPVYMFKLALSEGVQQDLRLAADRNILSMQDILAVDYHYGFRITGASGRRWRPTNAATSSNLAATAAGTRVRQTKMVPIVRLLVNTPFDSTAYS